jgi:uncharacterized protein with HEPN domain
MKRDDSLYIDHILECIAKIELFTKEMTHDAFMTNVAIQDAVIRNLEVIGEATKKLSEDFLKKNKHIPWSDMAGMRNKLIHDYFDVDFDIVWNTIVADLPLLKNLIQEL